MPTRPATALAAALCVLAAAFALCQARHERALQQACPTCIKSLVVLGDSLSDTGLPFGLWSMNNRSGPPERLGYNEVWSEIVRDSFKLNLTTFAFGGATFNKVAKAPGTVAQELAKFEDYVRARSLPQPEAVVLAAGANDFLYLSPAANANATSNITATLDYLDNIRREVAAIAAALLAAGHTNIIVTNLPPLDLTPYGQREPEFIDEIRAAVKQVNRDINDTVQSLRETAPPGANILLWDWDKLARQIVDDPSRYGLANVTAPCLLTNASLSDPLSPTAAQVSVCDNPDRYLFWDLVHPASGGMYALARSFFYLMRKNRLL